MDLRIPVPNGQQAARIIRGLGRSDAKSVLIIAVTANAHADDVQNGIEAGMNAYLAKPVDRNQLYATLSWAMNPDL